MKRKNKTNQNIKKFLGYSVVTVLFFSFATAIIPVNAYNCKTGDTECENAKINMEQKQNEANAFMEKANSVSEIIAQLNNEIAELDRSIALNESKIKDLNIKITETEKKLNETQTALAEMLINMHFSDNSEPIRILAGSKSISDYAEKTARDEVAKQEIALAGEKIKTIRQELNAQKAEVEEALRKNENEKIVIASKKENQRSLLAMYEKNADDASAVANFWEERLKTLAYKPPSNTVGFGQRWWGAVDTYPYQGRCPRDNLGFSAYGGAGCQCTSYASWKAYEKWGISNTWYGDAWQYASANGYYVPKNGRRTHVENYAAANTIAITPATWDSPYGHVMWVESVNDDGTINITEYNVDWPRAGCYSGGFCSRMNVGTLGMSFLHFD